MGKCSDYVLIGRLESNRQLSHLLFLVVDLKQAGKSGRLSSTSFGEGLPHSFPTEHCVLDANFPKQSSGRGRRSAWWFGTEWPWGGRAGLESLKGEREGRRGEREKEKTVNEARSPQRGRDGCQECGVKEHCPGHFFDSFQWLRLHTPNAGGWVPSLVRELDPICHK